MRIDSIQTLDNMPSESWNLLSGTDSFYLSQDWLRYVEHDPKATTEYLIASERDAVAGALPIYHLKEVDNANYRIDEVLEGRCPGRYLFAGTRHGYVNDTLVRTDLDSGRGDEVLGALLEEAEHRAAHRGLDGVLFMYLGTEAAASLRRIRPTIQPYLLDFDMSIPVPGRSLDDYLDWLPPNHARNFRREIRKFQRHGYVSAMERLEDCWQEAGPLVSNVQRHYGHDESPDESTESLRLQSEFLGRHAKVSTARLDGRLVAFGLLYDWRENLYGRLVGFDYEHLAKAYEYFNVFYYEPMRLASETAHRSFHVGRKSYEAKLARGAVPKALWAVLVRSDGSGQDSRAWNADRVRRWETESRARLAGWQTDLRFREGDIPADWLQ